MKNKEILLITILLFIFNVLEAQTLSESLGGIKTNFQIFSDTIDLKVSDQIIILRAEKQTLSYMGAEAGFGWGYGYQSFHLEFISKNDLIVEKSDRDLIKRNQDKLRLVFYDSNNEMLAMVICPFEYVDHYFNSSIENSLYFYSIDLIDIPVVILDMTIKINISKLAKNNYKI